MRTTIKSAFILAVLSVSLFSCNKSNDPADDLTGVLSGTIESYVSGSMDSVKMTNGDFINSTGTVSSAGKFSIRLKVPTELSKVRTYLSKGTFTFATGFTISDTTALVSPELRLYAYKSEGHLGDIDHCNSLYYNSVDPFYTLGGSHTVFIYCNKATTIKGKLILTSSQVSIYNMSLKEGWNEVVATTTTYTKTSTEVYTETTYTTDIPSDLKWYYTEEDA